MARSPALALSAVARSHGSTRRRGCASPTTADARPLAAGLTDTTLGDEGVVRRRRRRARQPIDLALARRAGSGLPRVTAATQDRFVPQMLNLEALGGVDFKKGCFPGQEVVARSQYLGKLKRRTTLASIDGTNPFCRCRRQRRLEQRDDHEPVRRWSSTPSAGPDRTNRPCWSSCRSTLFASDHAAGRLGRRRPVADHRAAAVSVLPDNEVFVRPKL